MKGAVAVAGLALVLAGTAGAGSLVALRSVERAFYEAHVPFSADWRPTPPNPYLVPKERSGDPRATFPRGLAAHLVGAASYVNASTFVTRTAYVFDSASFASTYRSWLAHHCVCDGSVVLRVRNVVYLGASSAAVRKAMARLSG